MVEYNEKIWKYKRKRKTKKKKILLAPGVDPSTYRF